MEKNLFVILFLLFTTLSLSSCGSSSSSKSNDSNKAGDAKSKIDLSPQIYDESKVIKVDIEIKESDWKLLAVQKKETEKMFVKSQGCPGPIPESAFTYFPAKVTIDGKEFKKVGVRKKGLSGSMSTTRPSLKIKFHEYDKELRFKGEKRLTLNNNKQDPSNLKACLAFRMFNRAKVESPRCTFAKVSVNGKDLGIYSNLEPIKKPFLERRFKDDSGNLYEGTVGDFRENWKNHLEKKTNESDKENPGLESLIKALDVTDDKLVESLSAHLDIDQFMRFWAMEVLLGHFDGYNGNTNNFYSYYHPVKKKFIFIPWGADATWNNNVHFMQPLVDSKVPQSVLGNSRISRRLYEHPEGRAKYKKQLLSFVEELWDEKKLNQEIDVLKKLLTPHLHKEGVAKFEPSIDKLRKFINNRGKEIKEEMTAKTEPKLLFPERKIPCVGIAGELTATLSTKYSDKPVKDAMGAGKGTFSVNLDGNKHKALTSGGSAVGQGDMVSFTIPAAVGSDFKIIVALFSIRKDLVKKGSKVSLVGGQGGGMIVFLGRGKPDEGNITILGNLAIGEINFKEASTVASEKIEMELKIPIVRLAGGQPL